ncbi:MAG: hypothetical protein WCO56_28430 [Verrucomicrobiota bacterium]
MNGLKTNLNRTVTLNCVRPGRAGINGQRRYCSFPGSCPSGSFCPNIFPIRVIGVSGGLPSSAVFHPVFISLQKFSGFGLRIYTLVIKNSFHHNFITFCDKKSFSSQKHNNSAFGLRPSFEFRASAQINPVNLVPPFRVFGVIRGSNSLGCSPQFAILSPPDSFSL